MKKPFSIVVLFFLLSSCSILNDIPREEVFYYVDFTKYSDEGFYISPESPPIDHVPVCMLDYYFLPKSKFMKTPTGQQKLNDNGQLTVYYVTKWVSEKIPMHQCLDTIVNQCKVFGANSIYNFKIETHTKDYTSITNPTTILGVHISGFAIKREN